MRIHIRPRVLCLASLPITYEEGLDEKKKKFPWTRTSSKIPGTML